VCAGGNAVSDCNEHDSGATGSHAGGLRCAVEGPFAALAAGGLTIACSRLRSGVYVYCALAEAGVGMVFIVQGKPREPQGIVKVIRQTRKEALETANDFLNEGFPFVSIVGDGRVYTVKEFATTVGNDEPE
jgi:hypothetical protein